MRKGFFNISRDIKNGKEWPEIEIELAKVFKLQRVESKPNNIIEYHGKSELFDDIQPDQNQQYDCIIHTVSGKIKFKEFLKVK